MSEVPLYYGRPVPVRFGTPYERERERERERKRERGKERE